MRNGSRTAAAICVAFALAGCEQVPTEPVDSASAGARFGFLNGPEHPGGGVYRFESYNIDWWDFPDTPSGDPIVLVWLPEGDVLFSCGGNGTSEPASVQEVLTTSGVKTLRTRRTGFVRAYDLSAFYASGTLCDALDLEPMGAGEVAYVWSDNDQFGETDSNTWGIKANGSVELDGVTYRVHLRANFQWITNRPESFKVLKYDGRIF